MPAEDGELPSSLADPQVPSTGEHMERDEWYLQQAPWVWFRQSMQAPSLAQRAA